MRWGLFWRSLRFDLGACGKIISGSMLLHNFLVDHQDETDTDFFQSFFSKTLMDEDMGNGDDIAMPLVTDNNAPTPRGRKMKDVLECQKEGEAVRELLRATLDDNDMKRPMRTRMKLNDAGCVYFDY